MIRVISEDMSEEEFRFLRNINLSEDKFNSYLDDYYHKQNSIYSVSNLIQDAKKQLFVVVNELKLNLSYSFNFIS